jgi:hypothetical protein
MRLCHAQVHANAERLLLLQQLGTLRAVNAVADTVQRLTSALLLVDKALKAGGLRRLSHCCAAPCSATAHDKGMDSSLTTAIFAG